MKRACFFCLVQIFATTFLLSQSNLVSPGNQSERVAQAGLPEDVVPSFARFPGNANGAPFFRPRTGALKTNLGLVTASRASGLNFARAVAYDSGGSGATSVAVADVNGDGKPDLVVANAGSNSVAVLLGNGDGTFQAAVLYGSGGIEPDSVAVADVNGDGSPDLIVANSGSGNIGVLLGNCDGTFQTAVTYASGGALPQSVAVADVNGDGKPDLVVANECGSDSDGDCTPGTVSVLLGNGNGTFQAAVPYGSAWYPMSVTVADVNGDGNPDLLVAGFLCGGAESCGDGFAGVLLGNGGGTFEPAALYGSGGFDPDSIAVADLDGDGTLDLVVANFFSDDMGDPGTVGVLLGNGNGTFQVAVPYGSGGYGAWSVAVADVNGDGKPDVVVASGCADSGCGDNGTWGVLLGNGNGTLQPAVSYASGGDYAHFAALGDVNGDGKPDVVVANYCSNNRNIHNCNNGTLGVLINTSIGPTTTALVSSLTPPNFGRDAAFTATVSSQGFSSTPTGKVIFMNGTAVLATKVLSGGSAELITSKLLPGSNTITAVYAGNSNFSDSTSPPLNLFVLAATTITLSSSPNPSCYGEAVTFTALVTSSIGAPPDGETVTFMQDASVLGTGALSGGSARLTISALSAADHPVVAVYGGDSDFASSRSKTVKQVVTKPGA